MSLLRLLALLGGLSLPVQAASPAAAPLAVIFPGQGQDTTYAVLLGGWANGRWQPPNVFIPQLQGRASWRTQTLSGQSVLAVSSGLEPSGAPCPETAFLRFPGPNTARDFRLASAAGLNTRPRPVDLLPESAPYREAVRTELRRQGLSDPQVHLDRIVRADLDGDGTDEVIIAASHFQTRAGGGASFTPPSWAQAGDYSLLLLRWVQRGQLRTSVLAANVFRAPPDPEGQTPAIPSRFDLAGVADLNGDGRMELVVTDAYYEGETATVVEWSPATGPRDRLSAGCGA